MSMVAWGGDSASDVLVPPEDGAEMIAAEVGVLFGGKLESSTKARLFRREAPPRIGVSPPHGVYLVSLEDAKGKNWLERSEFYSWRYVFFDVDNPLGVAEISQDKSGHYRLFRVGSRAEAFATLEAVRQLDVIVGDEVYELRFVRVISLAISAVWAHGQQGFSCDKFVIVPSDSAGSLSNPAVGYWEGNDFVELISSMAIDKVAFGRDVLFGSKASFRAQEL